MKHKQVKNLTLSAMFLALGLALPFLTGQIPEIGSALPADLRELLQVQLPRLEAAIWRSAEEETAQGLACNTGQASCTRGQRGTMKLVAASVQDEQLRRQVVRTSVLPRWLERCGARCAELWRSTMGPIHGIELPPEP